MTASSSKPSRPKIFPASAVVPTRHRPGPLGRALESLAAQSAQPREMVVVDASDDGQTRELCANPPEGLETEIRWFQAEARGAAVQRNQGVAAAREQAILFHDDDILFEPECLARLWKAFEGDPALGAVSAMIVNQRYQTPGRPSRALFRLLHGRREETYAGKMVGPALNLLPEDREGLPETVPVEWVNAGCTLYRREALPDPPFPDFFQGYSLMEDAALSCVVGRTWKLANARTARIFHDSQAGDHKPDAAGMARMSLANRYFVMSRVLGRNRWRDRGKLALLEAFGLATALASSRGRRDFPASLRGRLSAAWSIARGRTPPSPFPPPPPADKKSG